MESKLSFYDFIGYIIPGSIAAIFIFWIIIGFFSFSVGIDFDAIGASVLFLIISYFLGHLVQAYGNLIEKKEVKKWGGWFSEQYLRDDNSYYSSQFKRDLRKSMQRVFGDPVDVGGQGEEHKNRRQELFNLAYSLMVQEGRAIHIEIFNGTYSLYRGLIAIANIGIWTGLLIFCKNFILLVIQLLHIVLPDILFLKFSYLHLVLGLGAFLIFFFLRTPLEVRFARFGQHFANSVYRDFYVWSKLNEPKPSETK